MEPDTNTGEATRNDATAEADAEADVTGDRVRLSRVGQYLTALSYPVDRTSAVTALTDVTVLLADGETDLGAVVADCPSDRFDDADDLAAEVFMLLPMAAIGEPGQSEGDA